MELLELLQKVEVVMCILTILLLAVITVFSSRIAYWTYRESELKRQDAKNLEESIKIQNRDWNDSDLQLDVQTIEAEPENEQKQLSFGFLNIRGAK